jgi:hypothetical protein
LLLEPFQFAILSLLQQLRDEPGGGEESCAAALLAGRHTTSVCREGQGRCQMRLAGAAVAVQVVPT